MNSRAYWNPICLKNQEETKISVGLEPRLSMDLKSLQGLRKSEIESIVVASITCVAVSVEDVIDESTRVMQGREMYRSLSFSAAQNLFLTKMKSVSFCKAFLLSNLPTSVL
jgi:hypothetical protein